MLLMREQEFFREMIVSDKSAAQSALVLDHDTCRMALVSITEAAKLVHKNRSTIYRDIEKGRLSKTVSQDGDTQIDTSELLRAYGRLQDTESDSTDSQARERVRIALLEEKTRSLERVLALEAELRKVKDQVTTELRARLTDKENVIKVLESKLLF